MQIAFNFKTNQQFKPNLTEISFWFVNLSNKPASRLNKSSFIYIYPNDLNYKFHFTAEYVKARWLT